MAGLLALDWGRKKIGWATSDPDGLAITPRGVVLRTATGNDSAWTLTRRDAEQLKKLIVDNECGEVVLGLPLALDGSETEGSAMARKLASRIEIETGCPVHLVNEALSSWASKGVGPDDARAAAVLLEDHFRERHAHRSTRGSAPLVILAVLAVVVLAVAGWVGLKFYDFSQVSFADRNPNLPDEILVDVPPGSTFYSVEKRMRAAGLEIDPLSFRAWVRIASPGGRLKFGEYLIGKNESALSALSLILKGKVILHRLTIKEGANIWEVTDLVAKTPLNAHPEAFAKVIRDPKLLARVGVPELGRGVERTLEGYLFPETYSFQKYDTPRMVVEAMLREYEKRAMPHLKTHPWGNTPEGRHRLLTLASVVEKESGVFAEQPLIASVFWNRLGKKMPLQSDPTIIYGLMPNFDGNIRRDQIRQPHPYNTYVVKELPIGPISNPGENAVKSVVQPAKSDYIFFVSKGDGTHVFSADYPTHQRYVEQYQLRRRATPATKK